jgi:hypothetical protein
MRASMRILCWENGLLEIAHSCGFIRSLDYCYYATRVIQVRYVTWALAGNATRHLTQVALRDVDECCAIIMA